MEAGKPDPTAEQIKDERAEEPTWAGMPPPIAKPLQVVLDKSGTDSQEYRPISPRLALPPLIVGSQARVS